MEQALCPLLQVEGSGNLSKVLGYGSSEVRAHVKFEARKSRPGLPGAPVKSESEGKSKDKKVMVQLFLLALAPNYIHLRSSKKMYQPRMIISIRIP